MNNSGKVGNGPKAIQQMTIKEMLKEQHCLNKFLNLLESGEKKMPGVSKDQVVNNIRNERDKLQEMMSAFRNNKYEEYLIHAIQREREKGEYFRIKQNK